MTSEDMKLKKFEMLIRDIDRELGSNGFYSDGINPLEYFIDRNPNNLWLESIFNNTFLNRESNMILGLKLANIDKKDTIQAIERIRLSYKPKNHLLFWLIFIVSIDNENYNNNLSVVSDVAYMLGFSEEQLMDWITAVKGVLTGKKLNEIKYQTGEGEEFFLW